MKKNLALFVLSCSCILGITGCNSKPNDSATSGDVNNSVNSQVSESTEDVKVTGLSLEDEALSIDAGYTAQINVDVAPANASNKNVTFVSSDTSVATVDETGLVTAVNNGECVITVKTEDGNYEAECNISVTGYKLANNVFAGFSKLENNSYNTSEDGKNDFAVNTSNDDYTEITFNRSTTLEWASLVTWYERDIDPTLFSLDVELVEGDLPAFLIEFNGETNFKYFDRIALTKGEVTHYTLNVTDINLKAGDEGAGCWGAVNLEFNNPNDDSDKFRGVEDNDVTLRIHKMALTKGEKTAPSAVNNLVFDTTLKQIVFDKVFAAASYELELYKNGEKQELDTVATRFSAYENIPNMKVTFTPKTQEDFAKVEGNYTCKVRATNSAGSSEWEEVSFVIGNEPASSYVATGFYNNGLISVGQWNTNKNYTIAEGENGMEISFAADENLWDSLAMTFDNKTTATKLKMVFEVLEGNVSEIGIEFADWGDTEEEKNDGKQQEFFEVTSGKNVKEINITTDLSKGLGQLNLFLNRNSEAGNVKIVIYSIELL